MRVVFINAYQGMVNRGAETFVLELSKKLTEDLQADVISGQMKPIKRWPILWRSFLDPSGLSVLWFTLRYLPQIIRKKYDYLIPLNGGWQPAILRVVTWIFGGKILISGQSGVGWDDANNLWCFPNVFIALSPKALIWAKRTNPFVKSVYIPNGVNINTFTPDGEKMVTKLNKPIILCAGALTASKRIDLVIKAVADIKEASLLIVGDGEMKDKIKKLGEEMLGDRFMIFSLNYEEMAKVYRTADVFTLVSEPEHSFEIVLLEAMATNLPVVANKDPIRETIVGKAGYLVNPHDVNKYSLILKHALDKKWNDIPRKQAKKFSWNMISEQYIKLFNEVR